MSVYGLQGRSPGGSLKAKPPEADDLMIKYVQLYSTYVNQGRSDDSDTAHNANTDKQWHGPTPPLVSPVSHRICTNYKSGLGSPGAAVAPFAPY